MFDVYWWIISRSEPSTPILFASLRTVGHSVPGIKFATHHQLQSMSMPGRSSRSRRRWSISWRSTRCPTASTATGQVATAATGWPDIGVRLQAIFSRVQLYLHSFPSGENYPRLLAIKATWDHGNVFNHCQSVGSTDNSCCPFTLNRPQGPPPPWDYSDNQYSWHLTSEQKLTRVPQSDYIPKPNCGSPDLISFDCHTSHPANECRLPLEINWTLLSERRFLQMFDQGDVLITGYTIINHHPINNFPVWRYVPMNFNHMLKF